MTTVIKLRLKLSDFIDTDLENIIKTRDEEYDSRLIMHLVKAPVQDGGQWDMFVNLIEKYGSVPKDVMPETNHSSK